MNSPSVPRPEYPRPQFVRADWRTLNGTWSFAFDFGKSGVERKFYTSTGFTDKEIIVPFCPESVLSSIGHTDFLESIWYHRVLDIPSSWIGKQVRLHFGAVDYETHVFIDGRRVQVHYGGSASFFCDITQYVSAGSRHHLVLHVKDDIRSTRQPGGKQSIDFESAGCFYTRVTGIWQTVWMEALAPCALDRCDLLPSIEENALHLIPQFTIPYRGYTFKASVSRNGQTLVEEERVVSNHLALSLHLGSEVALWTPETPSLYDIKFEVKAPDGQVVDEVSSYFGMRKIHVEGNRIFLNNEPLYLRLVLDQGYYPDGIWTAPSDEALKRDIELGKEAGFNGARLHQKVFEERFHYWADTLGYLTWGEAPSWGLSMKDDAAARNFLSEWREIVIRDKNHPSLIAWTPLNETWDISDTARHRRFHVEVYELTKTLDPIRPVNAASGGCQVVTDLYTVHNYEQAPAKLKSMMAPQSDGNLYATLGEKEVPYSGQPYLVDEFGGIKWIPSREKENSEASWGYGTPPSTLKEFYSRLEGQVEALLAHSHISGYCYTQLTDVEQEQNGIYNYDRSLKFNMDLIRKVFSKVPSSWGKEKK